MVAVKGINSFYVRALAGHAAQFADLMMMNFFDSATVLPRKLARKVDFNLT